MTRAILLLLTVVIYSCQETSINDSLVIAHRGVPYFAPEETAPAFLLARELGADYLEADLQRTKDGVIIALHDDNLRRTTNIDEVYPERADDRVNTFTWQELQQLDAGSWFNEQFPELARPSYRGLKIISLGQLIKIAASGNNEVGLYLETKHPESYPGIEGDLKKLLKEVGWYEKKLSNGNSAIILQSFIPESISLLRKEFPTTPIAYLLWQGAGCLGQFDKSHLAQCLDYAENLNVDLLGVSFKGEKTDYFNQLEPWFIDEVRARKMRLHAYTFDTQKDIIDYAPFVDGQFTNRTDLSLDYYNKPHQPVEAILAELGY